MAMTIWLCILAAQLFFAYRARRKAAGFAMPIAVMVYVVTVQCLFSLISAGYLAEYVSESSAYAVSETFDRTMALYTGIYIIALSATLGTVRFSNSVSMRGNRGAMSVEMGRTLSAAGRKLSRPGFIGLCYFIVFFNAAFLDWRVVWINGEYLLMNSPRAYALPADIAMISRFGLALVGLYAAFMLPIAAAEGRFKRAALLFPLWAFVLLLNLAAHSRTSAVSVFLMAVTAAAVTRRWRSLALTGGGVLSLFTLFYALVGRGLPFHGIASIPSTLETLASSLDERTLIVLVLNIGQGVFATAESLRLDADHVLLFKLLSVSPLPSAMDGFDEVLRCCEIRVHDFVPMSAFGEAVSFGPLFYLPLAAFLYLLTRKCWILSLRHPGLVSQFLNLSAFIVFVMANAYPLRNVFRQALIILLLASLYSIWSRRADRRARKRLGLVQ